LVSIWGVSFWLRKVGFSLFIWVIFGALKKILKCIFKNWKKIFVFENLVSRIYILLNPMPKYFSAPFLI